MQFLLAPGALRELTNNCDQPFQLAQKDPQMAQDHADVVTAAAQEGEERVAPEFDSYSRK